MHLTAALPVRIAWQVFQRVAGFAFLLLVWSFLAPNFEAAQLPAPSLVLQALVDNFWTAPGLQLQGLTGGYISHVWYTASNAVVAFLVGSSLGMAVGLCSARLQIVRDMSAPFLVLFAVVPELVAAPFLLIWFGPGQAAQILFVTFFCFVIVAIAAQSAALKLAPEYEESAATLGAGRGMRFTTVVFPASVPAVIGAARVALATSWSLQAAAELLGSEEGVGRVVVLSQQLSFTAGTMAVIGLLGAVALAFDAALAAGLRRASRWQQLIGA